MSRFQPSKYSGESYGGGYVPDWVPVIGTWGKAKAATEAVVGTEEEWAASAPEPEESPAPPAPPPPSGAMPPPEPPKIPLTQRPWFWPVAITGVFAVIGGVIWFWPEGKPIPLIGKRN